VVPVNRLHSGQGHPLDLGVRGDTAPGHHYLAGRPVFDSSSLQFGQAGLPGVSHLSKVGLQPAESNRAKLGDAFQGRPEFDILHATDFSILTNLQQCRNLSLNGQ
jgi:hypothetical protein